LYTPSSFDTHIRVAEDAAPLLDEVRAIGAVLVDAFARGGTLYTFGNGGSAADAQHFTGELIGHYRRDRRPLPAVTLTTDATVSTCIANDYSFEDVFSRQVEALARPGDVVAAFTTTGRSANVIGGLTAARARGATTLLFAGGDGGPSLPPRRPCAARAEHADPAHPGAAHLPPPRTVGDAGCVGRRRGAGMTAEHERPQPERAGHAHLSPERAGHERAPIANAPSGAQPAVLARVARPAATPDRTLHMIGNAHLDPVWLWPWQEGYQEARATFASALDRMEEYPDFVFTCDQVVLLSWVEEQDPELFARIAERVAEGRWVNVGGWWVEPDCNMPMGESFARQGLYGQRYLQSRFGRIATVGMNVDPFGHSASLPQILRGQRMDAYCFLRPGPHESDLGETLFHWESADGSRVLAYRIPFEYCSPPGDVAGQTEKSLGQLDRSLGEMMVFYGVGNHGGGPTKANIDSIHRYDRMGTFGRMTMSSPRAYFDEMRARGDAFLDGLAVRRDDLQHHAPGCYSAHSGIKAWQRRAQHAVLSAERWAAIEVALGGTEYPREDLERAWKQILFNQFHDILPGSAIEPSYDDARDQLGEAIAISKRIIARAHNRIARRIDILADTTTQPVVVFNPHPWPVSVEVDMQYGARPLGVHVVDHEGHEVLSQATQSTATTDDRGRGAITFRADVPALGYALYRLLPGPAANPPSSLSVSDDGTVIENVHLRIELDPLTGDLVSLRDKETGVDPLAGTRGAPRTAVCEDPTDTWGHRVVSYAWPGSPMTLDRIVVRETGPLRSRVRVERSWGDSRLVEEYLLAHDARALRVDVRIDWREKAHLMKLRFPVGLTDPSAAYEIPYGRSNGRSTERRSRRSRGSISPARSTGGRPGSPWCARRSTAGTCRRPEPRDPTCPASASRPCAVPCTPGTTLACSIRTGSTPSRTRGRSVSRWSSSLIRATGARRSRPGARRCSAPPCARSRSRSTPATSRLCAASSTTATARSWSPPSRAARTCPTALRPTWSCAPSRRRAETRRPAWTCRSSVA